ncbi:uncharacterized protein LOC110238211 isoform X2 [Exaiptasia diaphana]|uniref:Kinesin motor domain-containing protein n=1 Tax=Exaiptasia diaphana TaxID=2652724 RepID=A0A913YHS0_EXADI|nr:uncharacterized protein LOC110238211 isoform X2 [Exaiptasia diaphana]
MIITTTPHNMSKLNLVDLAGSESLSVKKNRSMSSNTLDNETKHINLSLHYLETVIVALQRIRLKGIQPQEEDKEDAKKTISKRCQSAHDPPLQHRFYTETASSLQGLKCPSAMSFHEMSRKRSSIMSITPYIPYRNSLLTMLLQDSLGGNCNTVMIATLSMEACNINETISTCRFAQRVARVTNNPIINKTINEEAMIRKLQSKVAKLSKQLEIFKQNGVYEEGDVPTTKEEQSVVIDVIHSYLDGQISDPMEHGINDSKKIRTSLAYLKDLVIQSKLGKSEPYEKDSGVGTGSLPTTNSEDEPYSPTLTNESGTSTNGAVAGSSVSNITNQTTKPQMKKRNSRSTISSQHFFSSPVNSPELDKSLDNTASSTSESSFTNEEQCTKNHIDSFPSCQGPLTPANSTETLDQLRTKKNATSEANSMNSDSQMHLRSRPTSSQQSFASQRPLASCTSIKRDGQGVIEESLKKLKLLELELEKEKLIHKSKLLSTALSNQKARIMIMDKRGCTLDEIDNERLAEQQLRGKQVDVKKRLSIIVKRIVDTKSLNNAARLGGKDDLVLPDKSEMEGFDQKPPDEQTLKYRNIELKQQSARQKLLACREKLMPFLLPSVTKPKSPNLEENLSNDTVTGQARNICQYPPIKSDTEINSFDSNFSNVLKSIKTSKSEWTSGVRTEAKALKKSLVRTSSAFGVRTEAKAPKKSLVRTSSAYGGRTFIESKRKDTTSRILGQSFRKSQVTTETSRRRIGLSSAANREHQASIMRAHSYLRKGSALHQKETKDVRKDLSMNPKSITRTVFARYELEQGKGFIVCKDSKVYQYSNFKSDDFSMMRVQSMAGSQRTCNTSPWSRTREAAHAAKSASSRNDGENILRSSDVSPLNGRHHTPSSQPDEEHSQRKILSSQESGTGDEIDCSSPFGGDTEYVKRPISSRECCERNQTMPENATNSGSCAESLPPLPKEPKNVYLAVSPSVLKARKQQLERAKRIREVTHAVEIIQAAFRRYQRQKKG